MDSEFESIRVRPCEVFLVARKKNFILLLFIYLFIYTFASLLIYICNSLLNLLFIIIQICIMERFKTLNNSRARDIIRSACYGKGRSVFLQLYHAYDLFTDELYQRVLSLVLEICPLTMEIYKSLPFEVQNFFNSLWFQLNPSQK